MARTPKAKEAKPAKPTKADKAPKTEKAPKTARGKAAALENEALAQDQGLTEGQATHSLDQATGQAGEGSTETQGSTEGTTPPAAVVSRSVVPRDRYSYVTHDDVKTQSGRASVDNDDTIASALRGKTTEQVYEVLTASGGEIQDKWLRLNPGMQRMAAGNVIRRIYNAGEPVLVDGETLKREAVPKAKPKKRVRKPTVKEAEAAAEKAIEAAAEAEEAAEAAVEAAAEAEDDEGALPNTEE